MPSVLAATSISLHPTARARAAMANAMEVVERLKRLRNAAIGEPPPTPGDKIGEATRSYEFGELGELEATAVALEGFNIDANDYLTQLETALLSER
jgi:hypothetical protein